LIRYSLILIFGLLNLIISAQEQYTVSGYVKDANTGETLIGANIYLLNKPDKGTASNAYGFYSMKLDSGAYDIVCTYLGYQDLTVELVLDGNEKLDLELSAGIQMAEVVVSAEEKDKNISKSDMGTVELSTGSIKRVPALLGEVDVLKTLQLLPGVLSSGDGNAGFFVRGGGPDQNLVLLDEAVIYNSAHLFGFFSVFNADAIKNTTLIKGNMPAQYGGRVSSVLDIQMKDGNNQNFGFEGGIGTIASRFTAEGPIVKDKASFLLSGRRTYIFDLAQFALRNTSFQGTNYFFYDLNAKVNYRISDKDRIYLSSYFGRDVLNFNADTRGFNFGIPYGNQTASLRWNHVFSDNLFANTTVIYNQYNFNFDAAQEDFNFNLNSGIRDWNLKVDFDYFPSTSHQVKWGINYTYHKFTPSIISGTSGDEEFESDLVPKYAHETAIYASDEYKVNERWLFSFGLRLTLFTQLGPYTSLIDGAEYDKGEAVTSYLRLDPRFTFRYKLNDHSSIKGGWSITNQFNHLVSNSTSTLPTDIWVPSTEWVRPQRGTQYAVGYFRNFFDNEIETSIEVYYRDLDNQIDYREDYVDNASRDVEIDFVFGEGRAYGAEFLIEKKKGRLQGWIGYTLSRSERWFDDIEDGRIFPAPFDRTHDLSVVASYEINNHWLVGATFVYGTGQVFTPINGLYFIEQNPQVVYGGRNSTRLKDYHRLDLSVTWTPNPDPTKKFRSSWTLSVFNAYNRKNPFFVYTDFETDAEASTTRVGAFQVTLFPVIPSITWNFKWNQE
jgi:hypothetical protein